MNALESYFKDLAASLRANGHDDAAVTDILAEILADPGLDRANPRATLGNAKELARSYHRGSRRSVGFKVITFAAVVALLIIGSRVFASLVLNLQTSVWMTFVTYGAALALFLIGISVGATLDRRLPSTIADQTKR